MMRFFNTAGPVDPEMHYCVPPLGRLDAGELLLLIRQRKYFVLHAPRQTGKTSALLALRDVLNAGDEFRCVYVNVEGGQSARDLGLVTRSGPVAIANPIYREVIPRDLTYTTQAMSIHHDPAWYVGDDGALRAGALLAAFQTFFREHSEHWVERFQYREAGPQLLLQAFLQRVVNGGGRIEREYGLGRMRTDLLLVWPLGGGSGGLAQDAEGRETQKVVIECKVLHRGLERTLREGLEQTRAYMDRSGAAEGHLVIFDRTEGRPWEEKVFRRDEAEGGAPVTVWGM